MQIPKLTNPETKLIRTLEGWLIVVFNIGCIVAPIVSSVSPGTSLKYGAIFNGIAVFSRQGLKAVLSVSKSLGLPPASPIDPAVLPEVETLAPEIEAVIAKAAVPLDKAPESATKPDPPKEA